MFALVTLATLCALPLTGWMVRGQMLGPFAMIAAPVWSRMTGGDNARYQAAAEKEPNNFMLHLGAALLTTPKDNGVNSKDLGVEYNDSKEQMAKYEALQPLLPRFSREPALYALLPSFASETSFGVAATPADKGDAWTPPAGNQPWDTSAKATPNPQVLQRFLAYNKVGEQLEPDNQYFTLMRAYGLLVAQRADDAMQAVLEASAKSDYNDHAADQAEAIWAVSTKANGETGAIARLSQNAGIMYPYFARLRQVARNVTGRVIALEQEKKTMEALKLRLALLHIADTIQEKSTTSIGAFVASAIGEIAASRPGGVPKIERKDFEHWADGVKKSDDDISKANSRSPPATVQKLYGGAGQARCGGNVFPYCGTPPTVAA